MIFILVLVEPTTCSLLYVLCFLCMCRSTRVTRSSSSEISYLKIIGSRARRCWKEHMISKLEPTWENYEDEGKGLYGKLKGWRWAVQDKTLQKVEWRCSCALFVILHNKPSKRQVISCMCCAVLPILIRKDKRGIL